MYSTLLTVTLSQASRLKLTNKDITNNKDDITDKYLLWRLCLWKVWIREVMRAIGNAARLMPTYERKTNK